MSGDVCKRLEGLLKAKNISYPCVVCVTGKMASGKNFVSGILETLGFYSIDLDKEVHAVLETQKQKIFDAFSLEAKKINVTLKNDDGSLNRRALGELLFSNPDLLLKHESIIYPQVILNTENKIKKIFDEKKDDKNFCGVILNATVIYKTPELLEKCALIFYVESSLIKRFCRAKKRDGLPVRQIFARFKSQKGLKKKYLLYKEKFVCVKN